MTRPDDEDRVTRDPEADDAKAGKPFNPQGGEDESSAADEDGNDDHLHEDQKPLV